MGHEDIQGNDSGRGTSRYKGIMEEFMDYSRDDEKARVRERVVGEEDREVSGDHYGF